MERAMLEVTDKVSGRGVAGGRDNDGGRRRGRSGHGSGGEEGGASEGEGGRVASGRVGGEEAEASGRRKPYPLARASPARRVRRGRRPCSGAHRGNRKGARCGELGRLVEVGRGPWWGHGGQLGQSAQLRGGGFSFFFAFFNFQQQFAFSF